MNWEDGPVWSVCWMSCRWQRSAMSWWWPADWSVDWLIVRWFARSSFHSFLRSLTLLFIDWLTDWFVRSFIHSFIISFIHLLSHSLTHSRILSLYSFIQKIHTHRCIGQLTEVELNTATQSLLIGQHAPHDLRHETNTARGLTLMQLITTHSTRPVGGDVEDCPGSSWTRWDCSLRRDLRHERRRLTDDEDKNDDDKNQRHVIVLRLMTTAVFRRISPDFDRSYDCNSNKRKVFWHGIVLREQKFAN